MPGYKLQSSTAHPARYKQLSGAALGLLGDHVVPGLVLSHVSAAFSAAQLPRSLNCVQQSGVDNSSKTFKFWAENLQNSTDSKSH